MSWQKTALSIVALLVVGALAWRGLVAPEAVYALLGGIALPGPFSLAPAPPGKPPIVPPGVGGVVLALLAACVVGVALDGCSPSALSSSTAEGITETTADLAHCRRVGKLANSYCAYSNCLVEAGLHDAGCIADAGTEASHGDF